MSIWRLPPQPNEPATPLHAAMQVLLHQRRLLALCGYLVVLVVAMTLTTSFVGPYLQDADHASDALVGILGACVSLGEFVMGQALGLINAEPGARGR